MSKVLAAKQLKRAQESRCPYCGHDQVEGDHVQIESGEAWQQVSCDDCDRRWYEIYTLTRIGEIDP